jgi:hydrogenase expression/formation protein HypE
MKLPAGKLPNEMLRKLLASIPAGDPSVIVGSAIGEDAAVLDTGAHHLLVVKTDPITFAAEDIGHYLLAVNGNDLATRGAEPRWLLVTALLPSGIDHEQVSAIFDNLNRACVEAGVSLVGGHTEMTVALERPILVGCLLGTVPRDRLVRTSGARPGDAILLTGGIAIEGTAILAREYPAELRASGVDPASIGRAAGWLRDPGISVMRAARALNENGAAHSMHDPTEGGIATALHELAEAADAGFSVSRRAIPVLPECQMICSALGLDPLGLLASGALLATLNPADAPAALDRLRALRIPAAQIGTVVAKTAGRSFDDDEPLPIFRRDELARFLEQQP